MKIKLFNNWNFSRLLRLIIGGVFLIGAFSSGDVMMGIGAALFIGMAVLNTGCCCSGVCYAPLSRSGRHRK